MKLITKNSVKIITILDRLSFIHELYAVGGCVRDVIMDLEPHDIDLASPLTPGEFALECSAHGYETKNTGEKFGTVTVFIDGQGYEHTTFRNDVNTDGRHCEVKFVSTIEEDLARRDFTINALAMNIAGDIIDPYGGVFDFVDGIIRTIGLAKERFKEDKLRMLRAVRFAARFNFNISIMIRDYIKRHAEDIKDISGERIKLEFDKAFQDENPDIFLRVLRNTGLLYYILPEIDKLEGLKQNPQWHPEGNVFQHMLQIASSNKKYRWEFLLHDVGKGVTWEISPGHDYLRFHEHEDKGLPLIDEIARRFKFSNELLESCKVACKYHMQAHEVQDHPTERNIRRFQNRVGKEYLPMMRDVCYVDTLNRREFNNTVFEPLPDKLVFKPAVTGKFLMDKGFPEGRSIGIWKKACMDAQLDTGITDPQRLFEIVCKNSGIKDIELSVVGYVELKKLINME